MRPRARLAAGRTARLAAAGFGAWLAASPGARAQGLLPATGADVRVGDLRGQFARAFGDTIAGNNTRTFTYTPSLGVTETYDSGVRKLNGRNGADLITRITPELLVTGESSRLVGTFDYAPTAELYAHNGNLSDLQQNLNTSVTATLVPDLLFLDLRGYSAIQSYNGGQGGLGYQGQVQRQQQVQTSSFTATPSLRHQFGTYGQLTASYAISRTLIDASKVQAQPGQAAPVQPYSNSTTHQQNITFTTGDAFGRINSILSAAASQTYGGGFENGARTTTFNDQMSFAVTRLLALTAAFGHENISYGRNSYKIDELTWSGGVTLTPNADSSLAVSYGRHDGGTSLSVDGTYAPTARTRVYARYSQGLGTQLGNLRNAVANSTVSAGGVTIDPQTGAPLQLNTNTLGYQPGLYRTTRLSLSGVILFTLDTVTLSVEHDDTTTVATAAGGQTAGTANSGTTTSLAWSHVFTEALNGTGSLQYAANTFTGGGIPGLNGGIVAPGRTQTTVSVNLSLGYAISQTLSASASASFTDTSGITFGYPAQREVITVGLRKTF